MNHFKYYILAVLALMAAACTDNIDAPAVPVAPEGDCVYRFMAAVNPGDGSDRSRVEFLPDEKGLTTHWETGDTITIVSDLSAAYTYHFTAVKYVAHVEPGITPTITPFVEPDPENDIEGTVVGDYDHIVFFFEYKGSEIQNASNFNGTAYYRPYGAVSGWTMPRQASNGDAAHLRLCEQLTAQLDGVNFSRSVDSWVHDGIITPVLFQPAGEYAYLKIVCNNFKYSIWGGGKVKVYILDSTPDTDHDWWEPDAAITYGKSTRKSPMSDGEKSLGWPSLRSHKSEIQNYHTANGTSFWTISTGNSSVPSSNQTPFIKVPEHYEHNGTLFVTNTTDTFEPLTEYFAGADTIYGTFYIPLCVPPEGMTVPAGYYISTVLSDGYSGDLYVWEKKVPIQMTFERGKLYTLDYTDKPVEYAIGIVKNTVYLRNSYLEQTEQGIDGTAPRYTLFGDRADFGGTSSVPNLIYGKGRGSKLFDAEDVRLMRRQHGAFMQSGSPMVSICPQNSNHWPYSEDTTTGAWTWGTFSSSTIISDTTTANISLRKSYMSKVTKGYISASSDFHIGASKNNCYEFVLNNEYDPVMKSPRISNLWRASYGRDIMPLVRDCSYACGWTETSGAKSVFIIHSNVTGHRIVLPCLKGYNDGAARGKALDGTPYANGTWGYYNTTQTRICGSRSIRSLGKDNPAYTQTIAVCDIDGCLMGLVSNFNNAYPILPAFRWPETPDRAGDSTTTINRIIPWGP